MRQVRDPDDLRQTMADRGLSLRTLGKIVGCSEGTVRRMIAGHLVTAERARLVARALQRPVDELFAPSGATGEPQTSKQGAGV